MCTTSTSVSSSRVLLDFRLHTHAAILTLAISLAYVAPDVRYPPGWFFDGKSQVKHDPVPLRDTWEALEQLVDEGYIKHLGVSNMASALLMDLLSYARHRPSVLQIGAFCCPRETAFARLLTQISICRDPPLQRARACRTVRALTRPRSHRLLVLRPARV